MRTRTLNPNQRQRFEQMESGMFVNTRRVSQALAAMGTALALLVAGAGSANAYVYWANGGGTTLGQANPDGTSPNQSFITGASTPQGVALDGTYIYWANSGTNAIGRANLDGTGTPNQSFITGINTPQGVAVDGAYIYWANNAVSGTIGRANLDGTGTPNTSFITGMQTPYGVAVDGTYIYWTDYDNNKVGRANLDGTGVNTSLFATAAHPQGIAVDASYIYWTVEDGLGTPAIGRANLDGTGVNPSFVTGVNNPYGIAVGLLSQTITFPALPDTALTATAPSPAATATSGLPVTYSSATAGVCTVTGAGAISFVTAGTCKINADQGGDINWSPAPQQQQSFQVTAVTAAPDLTAAPISTTHGFTIQVGNYNPACGWQATTSVGTVTLGSAGLVTVSGLNPGQQATVTVTSICSSTSGSAQATGSALEQQTPTSKCVLTSGAANGSIPRRGTKRLLKPGCITNAGQRIGVSASGQLRGDLRLYKLFCAGSNHRPIPASYGDGSRYCRKGALSIRTFGNALRLRINWYAPVIGDFAQYQLIRSYKT